MSKRRNTEEKVVRDLILKDTDTEYGVVTKKLGNGRFTIRINMQNREVTGRLCGKFRKGSQKKNNWVDIDTVVLVGIREFQDDVVDIVHVYDSSEARQLKKRNELIDESISDRDINEEDVFDFTDI